MEEKLDIRSIALTWKINSTVLCSKQYLNHKNFIPKCLFATSKLLLIWKSTGNVSNLLLPSHIKTLILLLMIYIYIYIYIYIFTIEIPM